MPHTSQKIAWYPIPQPNSNENSKKYPIPWPCLYEKFIKYEDQGNMLKVNSRPTLVDMWANIYPK